MISGYNLEKGKIRKCLHFIGLAKKSLDHCKSCLYSFESFFFFMLSSNDFWKNILSENRPLFFKQKNRRPPWLESFTEYTKAFTLQTG